MIITVGNTKGGVGKTTVAIQIAVELARRGRDVWLIDADRQQTALTAATMRAEAGQQPALACSSYPDGPALRAQITAQGAKFDDVVIDAGGRDSSALRAALVASDCLLVPFQPRSFDVWALQDIAGLVDEARSVRDGLKAFAVLNGADPAGRDNEDAAASLVDVPQLTYLNCPIHRRKAYANAAASGLSVHEVKPTDPKAIAEIDAIMHTLFSL